MTTSADRASEDCVWPFRHRGYESVAKAAHAGDLRAVRRMLECGDDPDSYDPDYEANALQLALSRLSWGTGSHTRDAKIVKLLVDHGANVNIPWGRRMPLWVAEAEGNSEVAEILRRAGARLRTEGDRISIRPAKEREIRKVARALACQLVVMEPDYTKEQLAEGVEDRMILWPAAELAAGDYGRLKDEIRWIVRDAVGL